MTVMQKINKRIPGILPPPPKSEVDGKIENLSAKSKAELLDIRDRQLKLLNNKTFLSKLSDKGAKIQQFYDKIVTEIKAREHVEQTCRLLNEMSISSDKDSIQNLEWEGNMKKNENIYLDSDDDSEPEDTLHIISQSTSHEKKVKVMKPEKPLVTPEDLLSIGEIPHIKKLVDITEVSIKPKTSGQFKPYRTTISDVHNPEKEILRKQNKHWEVTAATPPPILHCPAKPLTIKESLNLQTEHYKHLKEIEAKHAAEKLFERTGIKMAELPEDRSNFGNYRSADSDDSGSEVSDPEGSDKEVLDEEPERGGVVFTVLK
ncbi:uncharacterized protein LOC120624644 [Pararge aegeria]|uniref:Jg25258 protein n=1 Tax=Pararge aegeria aegeria TaxID=348720 RepID=A0A8S4SBT9_9NEOP|nr:uncharacterized protein LOC120624644 [Pararge aegeria]CAH2257998.1 jg25258 [Pararge aegeria aegeria]